MSIRKIAMGVYMIDLTWTEDGRKQRLRRQFRGSLREARSLEGELRNEAKFGRLRSAIEEENMADDEPERILFKDFAQEWFETYVQANNRAHEQRTKDSYLRIHLIPFFGKMYLDEVGRQDLERFKALKVREGLSPGSINHYFTCLKKLYQSAVEWNLIDSNPVRGVPKLKDDVEKWSFLDFEESTMFLEAVPAPWRALFLCALRTGMRQGEILALRWTDIDWKRRVIRVRHSLSLGELSPTKSNSARDIPIASDLYRVLESRRGNGSELVFPAGEGGYIHRKTLARPLRTANRYSGVKRVRFHDLRHTFASHLVMAGVPIRTVQDLLGHADINMTLRYAHLSPEFRQEAISQLERHVLTPHGVKKSTLSEVAQG